MPKRSEDLCLEVRRNGRLWNAWRHVYQNGISSKSADTRAEVRRFQDEAERRSVVETLSDVNNVVRGWGNQYAYCNNGQVLWQLRRGAGAIRGRFTRETSPRNRLRTGLDQVPQEARMGERSGQSGSDGGTATDARRPQGLE